VYEAVHAEWRATVERQRRKRTQRVWLAIAASIVVAAVALFVARTFVRLPDEVVVATVSRSVGLFQQVKRDSGAATGAADGEALHAGTRLHTGDNGRAALALSDGVSLRLDHDTDLVLVSTDHVYVSTGAVYVDSGVARPGAARLQIQTPAGIVRHLGTQYEARILSSGTRVRVREGRVNVVPDKGPTRTLEVGDQIVVSADGVEERGRIEPSSDEWDWASSAAPDFDIDGKPVQAFLAWAARETGLKVVFATAQSEAEAQRAVLSGSIVGLDPDQALAAVLPTTSLKSTEKDGQLIIEMSGR
jgi:ferric-dicitrate binding protein FerR (iron transport regulator)